VQRFRGAPEVQLLGDGDEPADLDEIEVCDAVIVSPGTGSVLEKRALGSHCSTP
jgi:hypothetical protein